MTADPATSHAPAPGAEYADTATEVYRSVLQIIESVERSRRGLLSQLDTDAADDVLDQRHRPWSNTELT